MLSSMFQSSTLPVLEQVVNFTEARHGVLAGNIANLDTPGYKTRDLSPELFQERLEGGDRNAPPTDRTTTTTDTVRPSDRQPMPAERASTRAGRVSQSGGFDEKHPAARRSAT